MQYGLVGRKMGMTRIFRETGEAVPVTVIEVTPVRVTDIKTVSRDNYSAVQVTTGNRNLNRLSKAESGHFAKAKVEPGRGLWEFRFPVDLSLDCKIGDELPLTQFNIGDKVDITANTKGKGFAGVIKRHNFNAQRNSHGNSLSHRAPGSIGQCQTPGRVFKGKKMAGRMGNVRNTIKNLEVIKIDEAKQVILVKGSIPGAIGSNVVLKSAVNASA